MNDLQRKQLEELRLRVSSIRLELSVMQALENSKEEKTKRHPALDRITENLQHSQLNMLKAINALNEAVAAIDDAMEPTF